MSNGNAAASSWWSQTRGLSCPNFEKGEHIPFCNKYLITLCHSGELKTNEGFLKASASGTVPVIDDNGFHLFERSAQYTHMHSHTHHSSLHNCSVAIMKYLISKYNLPDNWYPSDLKQRARIDEYLNWHSLGMRRGSATYFVSKVKHYPTLLKIMS